MGECLSICSKRKAEDDEMTEEEYEKDNTGRTKKNKTRVPINFAMLDPNDVDFENKIEKDEEAYEYENSLKEKTIKEKIQMKQKEKEKNNNLKNIDNDNIDNDNIDNDNIDNDNIDNDNIMNENIENDNIINEGNFKRKSFDSEENEKPKKMENRGNIGTEENEYLPTLEDTIQSK